MNSDNFKERLYSLFSGESGLVIFLALVFIISVGGYYLIITGAV